MQADYSQHLMARDMQQAVRQIKQGPDEYCFHISQLWGIIVDNSVLVTCSTMSDDNTLGNNRIEMKRVPPKEKSDESHELRILVEYGGNTLWNIPLQECLTWFAFASHFSEFWPYNVQFYRHRKQLSSSDWPDIVELAQRGADSVLLEVTTKSLPSAPVRGVLSPIGKAKASAKRTDAGGTSTAGKHEDPEEPATAIPSTSKTDELSEESNSFSVFAWTQPRPGISRTAAAKAELGRIDEFIQRKTRRQDQRGYNECPEATPDEIQAELEHLAFKKKIIKLDEGSSLRAALRDRIDTFNSVVIIFTYFLPPRFDGLSTGKVWGLLKLLLDRPWPEEDSEEQSLDWTRKQRAANSTLSLARKTLRSIIRQILLFQQVMSHAPRTKDTGIEMPTQLPQAYIYFVLAFVQASADIRLYQSHIETFSRLLQEGMRTMLRSFSLSSLITYSSVPPNEVISLISLKLLNDLTGIYPNISSVYSQWIQTLVSSCNGAWG
ncbi:hypothetical protein GGR52DRAFT_460033 [Hypoxylon sp. FL1284]|nr:hypothetical protein GGR52DRAFT_460033 [Hypoxylon sp. FL1284]